MQIGIIGQSKSIYGTVSYNSKTMTSGNGPVEGDAPEDMGNGGVGWGKWDGFGGPPKKSKSIGQFFHINYVLCTTCYPRQSSTIVVVVILGSTNASEQASLTLICP